MMRTAADRPSPGGITQCATLAHVLARLKHKNALGETRRRDLLSAVKGVARLLGDEPQAIPLQMAAISGRLGQVNPVAIGISCKRLANIRSDFMAALRLVGAVPVKTGRTSTLSRDWVDFFGRLASRRAHIGLSRLARFASVAGIAPKEVTDDVISNFIRSLNAHSLCPRPTVLHRKVALLWNQAARDPALGLQQVTVPSYRKPRRIDWTLLAKTFREDADRYLAWCGVIDPFATNARSRSLAPATRRLRRDQIHAAVTALVQSGVKPATVRSLADLVTPDHVKRILRRRLNAVGGRENIFNHDLAKMLVRLSVEWVKVDARGLAELKRLLGKMPAPSLGLTAKNKAALRQFDDPAVLRRLYAVADQLFTEARRENEPTFHTLAKAQAALAIEILSYIPIRPQNLAALTFDRHLFLRPGRHATSTLELSGDEVKNGVDLAFDIPRSVATKLIEYRHKLAPKVVGRRPARLFVNVDGRPKNQASVVSLITGYLRRRAGVVLTAHQFRHLSAKIMLDAEPGAFELVRQLLGHKSMKSTVGAYAGIDSRRAARRHQLLVEQAIAPATPIPRQHLRSL
ncbi:MAG: tyrosine-type recombinase/integrase [Candidatus Sulfotelmatobacter sp.]